MEFEFVLEAVQVFHLLGGPCSFHQSEGARVSLVEDAFNVRQTFRPQAAVYAAHTFHFLGGEAVSRFQGVHVFQRVDRHPARVRLAGGPVAGKLGIVKVAFAVGGADDVHLVARGVGYRFRRVAASPRGDDYSIRIFAHGLIPEDGRFSAAFQHFGAPGEEFHHFLLRGGLFVFLTDTGFLTEVRAFGAFHPVVFRRFVSAQMHVLGREDVLEFIEDGVIEFPHVRVAGTYKRVGDARIRAHFQLGVREAEEFRIGGAKGLVVAGHVYFRDDFNVPGGGVFYQVLELFLGVHAAMGGFVAKGFLTPGGHAFQLGVSGHGKAPALVIRKVEMELVEFVEGHHINEFFDVLHRHEVARRVHHHTAPSKPGLVFDDPAGNAAVLVLGLELFQRVFGVKETRAVACLNFHALRLDGDFVSLRSQSLVGGLLEDFRGFTYSGGSADFDRFRDDVIGTGFHVAGGKNAAAHRQQKR